MKNKQLLMDVSSILGAFLRLEDEEYGEDIVFKGKEYHVPSLMTCEERFQASFNNFLQNMNMSRKDVICVKDPKATCLPRQKLLKSYKKKPREAPSEFFDLRTDFFIAAVGWLKSGGAIAATPRNRTEADDLINELAVRLPDTLIYTRDKDLLSCPTDVVLVGNGTIDINPTKFPVENKYIVLYRAIVVGDDSDNVKSVNGFGVKTWEKMVEKYGDSVIEDLQGMIDDRSMDELKPYVTEFPKFKLLIDQAKELYINYEVMKFFPVPAHEIEWEGGVEHGVSTLVTKSNIDSVMEFIKNAKFDYAVIDYESDVCDESREWGKTSGVKVDVMGQEIAGMGLRINEYNFYFSVNHKDTDNISLKKLEKVLELLWGYPIYAHNAAFENTLTYNHFGTLLPNMIDTMLMYSYVDENDYVGLKHLSGRWLNYEQVSYSDTLGTKAGMSELTGEEVVKYGIDDVITTDGIKNLAETILQYEGTLDVFNKVENDALYFSTMCFINGIDFDQKTFNKLKSSNDKNIEDSWETLNDMLLDLHWPGGEFEAIKNLNIVTVNKIYKAANGKDLDDISSVKLAIKMMDDTELAKLVGDKDFELINKYYKHYWKPAAEFNVRSPKQMSKLLYDVLKLPKRIRNKPTDRMKLAGKEGNPASNEAAILNAIAYGDTSHTGLLKLLLEYKGYLTKESLFLNKYPGFVHWKTGRIHASLRQSSTTTRRASCANPNNQQLPKKKGKEFRDMLKAPDDDWLMWTFDIDSQELKLQAWASQDKNFLACYIGAEKKDVHALTGYEVAVKQGVKFESYEQFTSLLDGKAKPFRVSGKATNFASSYLCRAKKLSQMLCVTESEAQDFLDAKAAAFPGLLPAVNKYIRKCRKRGYAKTFLGARRHLSGRNHFASRKEHEVDAAGRLAWSFHIQSSAGEQIKLTIGDMYRQGLFDDGLCLAQGTIHDEVFGIVHKSIMKERMQKLHACVCRQYADMGIETTSTPEVGSNFGSLKEWKL